MTKKNENEQQKQFPHGICPLLSSVNVVTIDARSMPPGVVTPISAASQGLCQTPLLTNVPCAGDKCQLWIKDEKYPALEGCCYRCKVNFFRLKP